MRYFAFVLFLAVPPAFSLTPEAKEFIELSKKLEPVQCQRRQLRREIALAQAERRDADARELRSKFARLDRNADTSRMEQRLAELERRIADGKGGTRDPADLEAISFQRREAFYRCD